MTEDIYFRCAYCPFWSRDLTPLIEHYEAVHIARARQQRSWRTGRGQPSS